MINERNSRLQETDFSAFNLREAYISRQAEYVAALRDEALFSNWGVKVLIRIPVTDDFELNENNVDEYSNFVDIQWQDTTELVIPLFKEYRQNQSENGMTADGTDGLYPLEVILPTKLHLPRNSRIIFSEYNSREEKIAREWTVLGTQMKQLSDSKTYSRVANCVPSRQTTYDSLSNTYLGNIFFRYVFLEAFKEKLKAQGVIWFFNSYVDSNGIYKKPIINEIQEIVDVPYSLLETINVLVQYLSDNRYILQTTDNFVKDDIVPLYIEEEGRYYQVKVAIDDEGTLQPLQLKVTEVDEHGGIVNYELLPNKGYSKLNEENNLTVIAIKDQDTKAIIKLVSVQIGPRELQEAIAQQEIYERPKYITPYFAETRFLAKKVAVSVLNW